MSMQEVSVFPKDLREVAQVDPGANTVGNDELHDFVRHELSESSSTRNESRSSPPPLPLYAPFRPMFKATSCVQTTKSLGPPCSLYTFLFPSTPSASNGSTLRTSAGPTMGASCTESVRCWWQNAGLQRQFYQLANPCGILRRFYLEHLGRGKFKSASLECSFPQDASAWLSQRCRTFPRQLPPPLSPAAYHRQR
ncbi:hypothetical protein FB45DRAFT_1032819 [Roridomyces roridus]|uniref:Uncharacterized protein n=1 Tax=Roridomyces roridus TaxID=1738132 RepID=A0AAD7BFX9_9AGAR|nr:hypothetical protein FB45DRAFT_1032819 [Roridomyces roridus]